MDTFEIRNGNSFRSGGERPMKWKSRIFVGIVGAVAAIGFSIVLFQTFIHYYQLPTTAEHFEVLMSDSLLDVQCEEDFCATKGCISTAARMLDILKQEVNPCEDFYEYACGNYKRGRSPRFQEESFTPSKEAEDNILISLKKIMDLPASDSDSDSLKKIRVLFSSCTNTERRDNASLEDLHMFLRDIPFNWPVLAEEYLPDGSDWRDVVRKLEKSYGIHTLFRKRSEISDDNPFGNTLIECKVPTLPAAVYLYENETQKPYILKMYAELIDFVLRPLGVERAKRKQFIREIITLETTLASAIMNSSDASGEMPSRHVLQILEENSDRLNELTGRVQSKCDGNVNKLLEVLQCEPDRVIKDYVGWRTVYNVLRFLNSDFKELSDAYVGSFPGSRPVYSARFRECAAAVRDEMQLMAATAYIDSGYFSAKQEEEVRGMMTEMKIAFAALLHILPWMDNNTLSVFQDKLKQMKLHLGYPEDIRNDHAVDHLFHDLDMNENHTYFVNVMKVRKHIGDLQDRGYRDHTIDSRPLGSESLYEYINNTVDVKLGLLKSPMMIFGGDYPKYLKYAHAAPLAHEISHAFDSIGSLLNLQGVMEGIAWWPDLVKTKFLGFIGCLRQQEAIRSGVPAGQTDIRIINNDIADLGVFFITYAGLSFHLRIHGEEEKPLPGLSLNKKQTFLVQTAQMFCDLREHRPTIDPYIRSSKTGKERVNSAISNFEDFGDIFDCPVGSPMNPAHKCNLLR